MHENLFSTISAKPNDNRYTEQRDGNKDWQCIASGKRYNSFFVLYSKIRGNFKNGLFIPEWCDFYLQTFDGDLTIGLVHVDGQKIEMELAYHILLKEFVYIMRIELEALNNNMFVKKCPIKLNSSNAFECIQGDAKKELIAWKQGIPSSGKIMVDMSFSDMSNIKITNGNNSQQVFTSNNPDSPMIDGDKYIREGSQLFKHNYTIHNPPDYSNLIKENDDLSNDCSDNITKSIGDLINIQWTWSVQVNTRQGIAYGLGCHPSLCKILF